jgi:cytoskeletal protein RodZ
MRHSVSVPPSPSHAASTPTLNLSVFRNRTGVSLEDIARVTKISLHFLRAIENEEFEKLPGGIFSTSYLRQYAAAIGYDTDALLTVYHLKANPEPAGKGTTREHVKRLDRWWRATVQASR